MTVFARSQITNKLVNEAANDSARVSGQDRKILPALGTNQIARFGGFCPLASLEKNKFPYVSARIYPYICRICNSHVSEYDPYVVVCYSYITGMYTCGVLIVKISLKRPISKICYFAPRFSLLKVLAPSLRCDFLRQFAVIQRENLLSPKKRVFLVEKWTIVRKLEWKKVFLFSCHWREI